MTQGGPFAVLWRVRHFLAIHRRSRMWLLALACQFLVASALMSTLLINQRMQDGLRLKAAEFIAADVRIGHHSLDIDALRALADSLGLRFSYARTTLTSALDEEEGLRLVHVKAVDGDYPLRGQLRFKGEPAPAPAAPPSPGAIWIGAALGRGEGERLRIGDHWHSIEAVIIHEPDQAFAGPASMPRIMMSHETLQASGLLGRHSRDDLRVMLAGAPTALESFLESATLPDGSRVIHSGQGGRADVREVVKNLSLFVNLAGLVAMLFSAIVLYLALQLLETEERRCQRLLWHWGHSHARRSLWFWTRIGVIALVANLLGALCALQLQDLAAERYLLDYFSELPPVRMGQLWQAVVLSLAALPIAALSLEPCLRRPWSSSEADGYRMHMLSWLALAGLTIAFFATRINNAALLGGLVLAVALSLLIYQLFARYILKALPARSAFWSLLRTSLAARPRLSMLRVCSLSLVMMIVMSVFGLREGMLLSVEKSLAPDTPNNYLMSIQPDEVDAIGERLGSGLGLARTPDFHPIVRARVSQLNGGGVDINSVDGIRQQRLLREWGLSYVDEAPNPITAGAWFQPEAADAGAPASYAPEWSISTEVVDSLGVDIGDELGFSIAGQGVVTGRISSIRRVDWTTIKPNFFVLASPGLLSKAPVSYITALRVDKGKTGDLARIAAAFPGVTHLDLNTIIDRFQELIAVFLEMLWAVLLYVAALALLALACILQFGIESSRRESALLRSFGVSKRLLDRVRLSENLALSLLAVLPASLIAGLSCYYFYTRTLQLAFFGDLGLTLLWLSLFCVAVVALLTWLVHRLLATPGIFGLLRGSGDYHH